MNLESYQNPNQTQLTTIHLVASVRAVRLAVAVEVPVDARFVLLALELVRSARYVLTDRRHLVVTLRAVLLAVADPALVDAGDPIAALVLQRQARIHRRRSRIRAALRKQKQVTFHTIIMAALADQGKRSER